MAKKIKIAEVEDIRKLSLTQGARIYSQLRHDVENARILDRDYGYYLVKTIIDFSGFFICVYQFTVQSHTLLLILWGILASFFSVQLAGLIHDAGHRAVFKSTFLNDLFGFFCSALMASVFSNWKTKHNAHHAHPNEEDADPDIEIPFTFTEDRWKDKKGLIGFIRRHQAGLYYPMGSLAAYSMRFKMLPYYLYNFQPGKTFELLVFLIGIFCWFVLPVFYFPIWKAALWIFLVNFSEGFYLLNVFAPNHKGMPQISAGVKLSFIEQQIITSRNIYGHWFTDYVYMGLNYQIEHHLFPNCPRGKLKLITPFVLNLCRKYGLNYTNLGVIESNKIILRELQDVSAGRNS